MVLGLPGRGVFAGLWLALAPASVLAQEPPPGFVWYVLDELNRASFDIEDPTNRPVPLTEPPAGVLMPVDVSRDGVADWLIRWPEDQRFCGTGGCRLSLYVSDGDRYLRVFDRQAWDPDIRTVGDEIRLEASFHHLNCVPPPGSLSPRLGLGPDNPQPFRAPEFRWRSCRKRLWRGDRGSRRGRWKTEVAG